jgi:hypothetical protein
MQSLWPMRPSSAARTALHPDGWYALATLFNTHLYLRQSGNPEYFQQALTHLYEVGLDPSKQGLERLGIGEDHLLQLARLLADRPAYYQNRPDEYPRTLAETAFLDRDGEFDPDAARQHLQRFFEDQVNYPPSDLRHGAR